MKPRPNHQGQGAGKSYQLLSCWVQLRVSLSQIIPSAQDIA